MITLIHEPGVYEISDELYHSDPCPVPSLSNSIAKILLDKSPRHAWAAHPRLNPGFARNRDGKFDIGTAGHALMLGGEQRFAVIEADDWRTKAAKEARERAYEAGKTPLLEHQWPEVKAMVYAGRAQLAAHEDAQDAFSDGKPEVALIWREGDVWCRCKLDWLPNKGRVFRDYKTTAASANPEVLARTLYDLSYDVQSAFYRRGIRAVLGEPDPVFEFVFQETSEPYALSVVGLPPSALELADRKVDAAIEYWRWCTANDKWPGYPTRTAYIEPPTWHQMRWLERETRESMIKEAGDEALYRQMNNWQAPLAREIAQ